MEVEGGDEVEVLGRIFTLGIAYGQLLAEEGLRSEGELGHTPLTDFANLGEEVADADGMKVAEGGGGHHLGVIIGRVNKRKATLASEMLSGISGYVDVGKSVLMTSHGAGWVVGLEGGIVKRGIADNELVAWSIGSLSVKRSVLR